MLLPAGAIVAAEDLPPAGAKVDLLRMLGIDCHAEGGAAHGRNLASYQRAELALKVEPLLAERAHARERLGGQLKGSQTFGNPVHTNAALGKLAGVFDETIRKAKVIAREADEPTKETLRRGQRSIHRVY